MKKLLTIFLLCALACSAQMGVGVSASQQTMPNYQNPGGDSWTSVRAIIKAVSDNNIALATYSFSTGPYITAARGTCMMADGRIYITQWNGVISIYNPIDNSFATGPATSISGYDSILLQDGRIMEVSADDGYSPKIYSPKNNTVTAAPALPNHAKTLLPLKNGLVLIVVYGAYPLKIYNPQTNTYTDGPESARSHGAVLLPNGKVLITAYSGTGRIYDPVASTSIEIPAITGYSGAVLMGNGKVLCIPRADAGRQVRVFNPNTSSYETGPLTTSGMSGGCLLPDGKVLMVPIEITVSQYNINVYDSTTNTIVFVSSNISQALSGAVLMGNGKVFISKFTVSGNAQIFDPQLKFNFPSGVLKSHFLNAF